MLTLYVKTGCPYCAKVLAKLKELGTPFEEKNISDPDVAKELIDKGGKKQVPFLSDHEREISIYESEDIVKYLEEHHTKNMS